ncbi:hypothetical protein [Desulfurispora thermophila]|uniref:hypothetical protein n=1 Tax=Desulfurispora thermophila TaxID=265470 RepID=UPI0012EAC55A|nr:hypothetical protein [Desulfurispora thermophila]
MRKTPHYLRGTGMCCMWPVFHSPAGTQPAAASTPAAAAAAGPQPATVSVPPSSPADHPESRTAKKNSSAKPPSAGEQSKGEPRATAYEVIPEGQKSGAPPHGVTFRALLLVVTGAGTLLYGYIKKR